jgi:hypothetical protein
MRRDEEDWRSSFPPADGESDIINVNQSILTVFSASKGTGGHASMFLESLDNGKPKCQFIDLTTDQNRIKISITPGQMITPKGEVINLSLPKGGDPEKLRGSHYQCFVLDREKHEAVITALGKFKLKVDAGRYVYRAAGGALGWISSVPGTRGVNCADFVIKVLRDAGVKKIPHLLFDTPFRVATRPQ